MPLDIDRILNFHFGCGRRPQAAAKSLAVGVHNSHGALQTAAAPNRQWINPDACWSFVRESFKTVHVNDGTHVYFRCVRILIVYQYFRIRANDLDGQNHTPENPMVLCIHRIIYTCNA